MCCPSARWHVQNRRVSERARLSVRMGWHTVAPSAVLLSAVCISQQFSPSVAEKSLLSSQRYSGSIHRTRAERAWMAEGPTLSQRTGGNAAPTEPPRAHEPDRSSQTGPFLVWLLLAGTVSSIREGACGAWHDLSTMVHLLIELAGRLLAADRAGDGKGARMLTITTQQGKEIEIVLQTELRDPLDAGAHVRAYCHHHGSDQQRSLSIDKATGWGHCFNAACEAPVLVAEWIPVLANRLLETHSRRRSPADAPACSCMQQRRSSLRMPVDVRPPARLPPAWQQEDVAILQSLEDQLRAELVHAQRAQAYLEERK